MAFQEVEHELWDTFLQALFKGATSQFPMRAINGLPLKQARISLTDLTWTEGENLTASCVITENLFVMLRGTTEFSSGDHTFLMGEGRLEIRRRHT